MMMKYHQSCHGYCLIALNGYKLDELTKQVGKASFGDTSNKSNSRNIWLISLPRYSFSQIRITRVDEGQGNVQCEKRPIRGTGLSLDTNQFWIIFCAPPYFNGVNTENPSIA